MGYSQKYIMQQLARGRPVPTGSPDPELFQAIRSLASRDIDDAVCQKGASPSAIDAQGRTAFHALLDRAQDGAGNLAADPQRVYFCIQALVRVRADLQRPCPRTGLSALARASFLAATPQGAQLFSLLGPLGNWDRPERNGKTPRQMWTEHAAPDLQARLTPIRKPGPR